MDRIELDEEIETQQYDAIKAPQRLNLPALTHFKVKKVSNPNHARNTALSDEIHKAYDMAIPWILRLIKTHGYQFILETFAQIQKNTSAKYPRALFLWTIKNCKVELKEVELK